MFLTSCAGINTVQVCAGDQCATGYYDDSGDVVTAAHSFEDEAPAVVSGRGGYEARGVVTVEPNDTAKVRTGWMYQDRQCYATAAKGDRVTVSTLYGPVRARVKSAHPNGYVISAKMLHGDSGSPVSRRGCIVGFVHGLGFNGTVILKRGK